MVSSVLALHVLCGFIGLLAFWVAVLSKKGSTLHLRFGKAFVFCVYGIALTAIVVVTSRILDAVALGKTVTTHPSSFAAPFFLAYLALTTYGSTYLAIAVVRTKAAPQTINTPIYKIIVIAQVIASFLIIAFALTYKPSLTALLLSLSPIGFLNALAMQRYVNRTHIKMQWLYTHLGSILGAGIVFHTAFFVFGANRLGILALPAHLQLIPWLAPAIIGIPVANLWEKRYRKKFGDLPNKVTAKSPIPSKIEASQVPSRNMAIPSCQK